MYRRLTPSAAIKNSASRPLFSLKNAKNSLERWGPSWPTSSKRKCSVAFSCLSATRLAIAASSSSFACSCLSLWLRFTRVAIKSAAGLLAGDAEADEGEAEAETDIKPQYYYVN